MGPKSAAFIRMDRLNLRMIFIRISIGLLMLSLRHPPTLASNLTAARPARCVSERRALLQVSRFLSSWGQPGDNRERQTHTCALHAGNRLACRSLSPWKFSIEREDGRFPQEIARAECLYHGCVIDQQEDFSYNSVPVFAQMAVLRKSPCRGDPRQFVITRHILQVPVACTCVLPAYAD